MYDVECCVWFFGYDFEWKAEPDKQRASESKRGGMRMVTKHNMWLHDACKHVETHIRFKLYPKYLYIWYVQIYANEVVDYIP